jgi:hypothetical protein
VKERQVMLLGMLSSEDATAKLYLHVVSIKLDPLLSRFFWTKLSQNIYRGRSLQRVSKTPGGGDVRVCFHFWRAFIARGRAYTIEV